MTEVERAAGRSRRGSTRGHAPGSARRHALAWPGPCARTAGLGTAGPVGRVGDAVVYGVVGPRIRPARAILRAERHGRTRHGRTAAK
jgi:hypothetical protein